MAPSVISSPVPEPLSAVDTKSFASMVVQHRMPAILGQVIKDITRYTLDPKRKEAQQAPTCEICEQDVVSRQKKNADEDLAEILNQLADLALELKTNEVITAFPLKGDRSFMGDISEWNSAFELSPGRNLISPTDQPQWLESSLLFVECYMYRRIMSTFYNSTHHKMLDPFQWLKAAALDDAVLNVHGMLDYLNGTLEMVAQSNKTSETELKSHFEKLLRLAVWGNKGDLSHTAGQDSWTPENHDLHNEQHKMKEVLVVDHSDQIWRHLTASANSADALVRVDIVCDNYGVELVADLIFGEFLIASQLASQVCYHVKAMPWLVSDTTVPDFWAILDVVNQHPGRFGDKWRGYLMNGTFTVTTDQFWTLPYDFDWMERKAPELYSYFQTSTLVIFKGDLNYRKLTGDLNWPHTTPFRTALRSFQPAPLCSLRGLKSEVVVGLQEGQADQLQVLDKDWLVSGEFAVVQFTD